MMEDLGINKHFSYKVGLQEDEGAFIGSIIGESVLKLPKRATKRCNSVLVLH